MQRLAEIAPGVLVATAEFAMTTSTVVTAPDGACLVIDPAVSVADLAGLAADLAGAGLRPQAGFATHPHWDHVLWSADLGDVPRYGAAKGVAVLPEVRPANIEHVEAAAPGHDLALFGQLVALPADPAVIPWDGPLARVIVHDGHAPGHGAVFLPDAGVLVAGDMLSDIEMPLLDIDAADPLGDYRAGLERLAAVAGSACWCRVTATPATARSSAGGSRPTCATWTCWPPGSRSMTRGRPTAGCATGTSASSPASPAAADRSPGNLSWKNCRP